MAIALPTGTMIDRIVDTKKVPTTIPHVLRIACVITFPPGFVLLFIHGCVTSATLPAVGIIPLFMSAAASGLLLANEKDQIYRSLSGLTGTTLHALLDSVLAIGLLVCLIVTWVQNSDNYRNGAEMFLASYGTVFLMVNLFIHCYFLLRQFHDAFLASSHKCCPHCHGSLSANLPAQDARDDRAPLLDDVDQAPTRGVEKGMTEAERIV